MRLVRNAIVHNGGIAKPLNTVVGREVRDFESDISSGAGLTIQWQSKNVPITPFYTLGSNGKILMLKSGIHMIRFLAVTALETEGKISVRP